MLKKLFSSIAALVMLSLPMPAGAADLKITWNPNTEPDLAGYRVYESAVSGGPYTRIGEVLPSPTPSLTWSTPPQSERMYYVVATAFDAVGNESAFSAEANIYVDEKAPNAPKGIQIIVIVVMPPAGP